MAGKPKFENFGKPKRRETLKVRINFIAAAKVERAVRASRYASSIFCYLPVQVFNGYVASLSVTVT